MNAGLETRVQVESISRHTLQYTFSSPTMAKLDSSVETKETFKTQGKRKRLRLSATWPPCSVHFGNNPCNLLCVFCTAFLVVSFENASNLSIFDTLKNNQTLFISFLYSMVAHVIKGKDFVSRLDENLEYPTLDDPADLRVPCCQTVHHDLHSSGSLQWTLQVILW